MSYYEPSLPAVLQVLLAPEEGGLPSFRIARERESDWDAVLTLSQGEWSAALVDRLAGCAGVGALEARRGRIALRFTARAIAEAERALSPHGRWWSAPDAQAPERCVFKFWDPNATKALHVGHTRNLAVGHGLSCLYESSGIETHRLAFVCDTGRPVAEAMAGYLLHHRSLTPESAQLRGDVLVGRCYRAFAASTPPRVGPDPIYEPAGDAHDLADRMAAGGSWDGEDLDALRQTLVTWVLDGQLETLTRLGIIPPRLLLEAEACTAADAVLEQAVADGHLRATADGRVEMPVDGGERGAVTMRTATGELTAHTRNFVIWSRLQHAFELPASCMNVVGDEWAASARARETILKRMQPCPLYEDYRFVGLGMVYVDGDTLKSRDGASLLLEDCLDRVDEAVEARGLAGDDQGIVSALVLKAYFLQRAPNKIINFDLDDVLSDRQNVGWALARALAEARGRSGTEGGASATEAPADARVRRAVLDAFDLAAVGRHARRTADLRHVLKHLRHVADAQLRRDTPDARLDRIAYATLTSGMAAIGLIPGQAPALRDAVAGRQEARDALFI